MAPELTMEKISCPGEQWIHTSHFDTKGHFRVVYTKVEHQASTHLPACVIVQH